MIDHRCDYFLGNEVGRWLDENETGNVSEAYTELGDMKLPAPSKCKRLVRIEQLSELDIVYCQVNILCLSCICKHIEKQTYTILVSVRRSKPIQINTVILGMSLVS